MVPKAEIDVLLSTTTFLSSYLLVPTFWYRVPPHSVTYIAVTREHALLLQPYYVNLFKVLGNSDQLCYD